MARRDPILRVLFASLSAPIVALVAAALGGVAAVGLMALGSRKAAPAPGVAKGGDDPNAAKLENYQMILDTLDQSNILLWWARVTREGSAYNWKIRAPKLRNNPTYRLAALVDEGGLWKDEQAPDNERTKLATITALAQGAREYHQEFRIIGSDGMHWLSEEVVIRPAGPDEWNLAGAIVDVTKRHEAEEAHRLTEGQLEEILKRADCLLWQAAVTGGPDTELKWQMFIPPSVLYRRIFGDDPVPGQNRLWTETLVPEWAQIQGASTGAMREGRPSYDHEFHVVTGEHAFCLHEHVSVVQLGPGRWNLVGVIVDITARRDAELALASEKERLAVTLGTMSEGVITMDARGRVLFINRAAADMVQWNAAETVGREVSEICRLLNASSGAETVLPVREILEGGSLAELPPQTLLRGRWDRMRLVEGRMAPVADYTSKRVGAVFVLRDVTERQRMEEKLQNAAKMESVGILAGGIAHDFNNILTAILANLTLLQLDLMGMPQEAGLLEDAVRATKRAGELTLQLLTFAKGGDPVRTAVHLNEVIRESATFANRGSGVKTEFEMPGDLRAADVDKAQISQVIQNLVINANQAMPGGGTLRIAASNERIAAGANPAFAEGDYVRITVTDTGMGIPPEHIAKIFDPYFTTRVQGHGLGLATVFSIVRRHQGHVEVNSVVGKGSVFTIWLPAAPVPQAAAARSAPAAGIERGKRVLFMDDEEPILRLTERLMVRLGLEFESALDGRQAIERFRAARDAGRPFDLVVMDLTIPGGMGGKEAIAVLREIDPGVRAIVSSGYSSDLAMADFRKHGFRGMVAKPYDVAELASVIRSVLNEPR
jgi:PAS domain S-box-containing protein